MSLQLKILDRLELNGHVSTNFACEYSEDGKICILMHNNVCILTLKPDMDNMFTKFSFKKDTISLSEVAINENLDVDLSSFIHDLSRNNLYETVLDLNISANTINALPTPAMSVSAMWSPRGIVEKTDAALAVLTTLHNIEIYVEVIDENDISTFIQVVNFAKDITEHFKKMWKRIDSFNADEKLGELKKRAAMVTPTAFTWSHVILKDRKACCILFVGHQDGAITVWRFLERKASEIYESKLQFLERYETTLKKITALHWFCRKSDAGGLSIGDANGHFYAVSVSKLSTDKIKFSDEVSFSSVDDLKVDKITLINHQNITYLVAIKQNYLQVYAINSYGEVIEGKLVQVGNLYITGVLHYDKNILFVLSVCGQLKEVHLSLENNELVISQNTIAVQIDTNKYRTHGFLFSPNKVFLAILAYPCQQKNLSRCKNFVNFFVYHITEKQPFKILMDSSAPNIRDYWDCFETLRVICLQDKVFPWKSIDCNINYDTLPLVKLKIMRWISKLYEMVYPMIPRLEEYYIKASYLLNYMVDIKLAVQRITKLLNIYFSEKKLSLFQMQSLDLLNFFLKEAVVTDILTKANVGETFVDEIYNVVRIANELQYPPMPQCLWCGEKIIGSSCVPYHMDSRCAISLMPLSIIPGYKCPFCNCVVSKEMDKEYYPIFCPYCDIPMKRRCFDKKYKKTEDATEVTKLDDIVSSECSNDCVTDEINFADIEENSADFVVLTDSENDEDETKELYDKIKKITLATPTEQGVLAPYVKTGEQFEKVEPVENEEDNPMDYEEDEKSDAED